MKSILIILDNKNDIQSIKTILDSHFKDYSILISNTSKEGIETAKSKQPDIIIIDFNTTGSDGYENCIIFKNEESTRRIPLIGLVNYKKDNDKLIKALDNGVDAFVSKPINSVELIAQIKVMLRTLKPKSFIDNATSTTEQHTKDSESNNIFEDKYSDLANLLPQIVYEHDLDGRLTFFNEQAYKSLGYTREEFENSFNVLEVFIPSEREIIKENINKLAKGKKPHNGIYNLLRKDGSTFSVLIYSNIVFKNHKAVGIRGVVVDISSTSLVEAKLREQEDQVKTLYTNISDILQLKDPESIYKYTTTTLSKKLKNTIVLFISIDHKNKLTKLEAIEGIGNRILNQITKLTGFKIVGKTYGLTPLHEEYFKSNELIEFKDGLADFAQNEFPSNAAKAAEKLLGINKIYTIGINRENQLLAAVHFITYKNQTITNVEYITSFIKQVSMVLLNRLAEKTLKQSEERFRSLYNNSALGLYRTTPSGKIIMANPTLIKILGFDSFEELTDRNLKKTGYKNPTQRIIFTNLVEKNGELNNFESIWLDKYGNEKHISESAKLVLDKNGKPLYYDGTVQDITQQKEAETALEKSESKFHELFEKSSDAVVILTNRKISDCNESFIKKLKFNNKEEVLNSHPSDISPEYQPDGRLSSEKAEEMINEAVKNSSKRFEWNHKKTNGEIIPMEVILTTINSDDETEIIHAVMRDITERKKAESELRETILNFRLIFENSPIGIYLAKPSGKIIDVNQALINILGSPSIEETKKINVLNFPPLVENGYAEKFKECIDNEVTLEFEMDYLSKWGKSISLHSFLVPLKDSKGKINTIYTLIEDITDRKITENALRESENRFLEFMRQLPAGIFIKDEKGHYLFSNKYNEEVHGIKHWRGKTVYDYFPKEVADKYTKDDQKVLEGNDLFIDGSVKDTKGNTIFFKNRQFRIDQSDGTKLIGGISLDVTREKQAEIELKESEEKYRTMIETSNDLIWIINLEGNFTFINKKAEETTGYTKDEWLGQSYKPLILEEEVDFIEEVISRNLNKETVNYEASVRTKNGETRTLTINSAPIFTNEQISGIISFGRDITAQKKQDLIRQIIFNISTAAITSDNLNELTNLIRNELGKLIDTQNFYLTLIDPLTKSLHFPFFVDENDDLGSFPKDNTLAHHIVKTKMPLLLSEKEQIELEKREDIISYGTRPLIWLGVPLVIDNEVIGVIVVQSYKNKFAFTNEDQQVLEFISGQISMAIHRKNAEENLREALLKAEESDRLKSAFLANMSHEIRTPMNGILGFSQLIKDPDISREEHAKYVEIIEKSGERLLNIINDLVDISKIEAGQMDVSVSMCDIHEQLNFLYTFFKPEAEVKGLNLKLDTNITNVKLQLFTDREKLYAIFTNLIKNAIKYSRKGEIDLGYNIVNSRPDDLSIPSKVNPENKIPSKMIEFYVADTGIGIPKDRIKAIFDRFVQADIEDSNVFEGAGLGLSITQAYVEMLGGKIWVESEENKGSKFFFTLPFFKENDKEEVKEIADNTPKKNSNDKTLKIMIAEDEKISDAYLTAILKKINPKLYHVTNGKQAVDFMKENPDIDLILMDIKMPILGGYEATQEIRKFNEKVIIIAQTAYALAGDNEKAIKSGCNDYISKPVNSGELMNLIEKYFF